MFPGPRDCGRLVAAFAPDWAVVVLIAAGSTIGGQLGGHYGRRLPAEILRACIVVVGLGVAIALAVVWR